MKQLLNKVFLIIILTIAVILPFSYGNLTGKWFVLFLLLAFGAAFFYYKCRKDTVYNPFLTLVALILLLFMFSFAEKVDFIQQFGLTADFKFRIPLSTIFLAIGALFVSFKALVYGKIADVKQPIVRYFLASYVFVAVLMILLFPLLRHTYQMKLSANIPLLNVLVKYLVVVILALDCFSDRSVLRKFLPVLVLSVLITAMLSILL